MQIMETRERRSQYKRTTYEYTNYSTTDNGRGYAFEKDAKSDLDLDEGKELENLGISIVDTDAKNFSDVTPEEVSDYYKSLGEWQNVLPKTDYTYSPLSRFYTKKINGKIPIIPNMSRRQIWRTQSEIEQNEINMSLNRSYEFEETLRKTSIRWRMFDTFGKVGNSITRRRSTDLTNSNFARNCSLVAFAILFFYFLFPFIWDAANTSFTYSFCFVKYLVFNLYDLTCSSGTFVMSVISVFFANVASTVDVFVSLANRRNQLSVPVDAPDIGNLLERWLQENSADIAKKVVGSEDFIRYVDDRFRQQEYHEEIRFEKFLRSYDFHNSEIGRKLSSLEAEVNKLKVEDRELKDYVDKLREEIKTKDVEIQKQIIILLSSFVGGDQTADSLKDKFASLFESVKTAHTKIDNLTGEFYAYAKNNSEYLNVTKNLYEELVYNTKISIYEMVSDRMQEWRNSKPMESMDRFDVIEKYVKDVIKKALEVYDADKTGKTDFALESQGGSILSIRCTETKPSSARVYVLGVPMWYAPTSPRTVIQPGAHPGECWAFWGSTGFLVIKLSRKILITGFSMEHESRLLAVDGKIESAPKDFIVSALHWEMDPEPKFLGQFRYSDQGPSVQYFEAVRLDEPYEIVELKILSNHGKLDYTCLYRFRVHGIPA